MKRPGIESPCPTCQRTLADHTVREWVACAATPWEDLAYEPTVSDGEALPSFSLEGRDVQVADTLTVRSLVTEPLPGFVAPVLMMSFAAGRPGMPPLEVAEVCLLAADTAMMRKFGKLLRDGAFGAANAVERQQ